MTEFPTFTEFYRHVYGYDPFPWQNTLAATVVEQDWPEAVTVPTGLGKTSSLVVAVWHLASQAHQGMLRTAALRMLHVVDRTTIVDQTHHDITRLAGVLDTAEPHTPAGIVADALACRFGLDRTEDSVLLTGKVHGAIRDTGWVSAHRPVVVTMTAHQAVSRVLFRGFGVSPGMAPVHAATVGMDSLILLDEPHLSTAAWDTLRAAKRLQVGYEPVGVPVGRVVALGATLPATPAFTVGITEQDRVHPVAGLRLRAAKTLHRHQATTATAKTVAAEMARIAKQQLTDHPDDPVAVVCNTVDVARQVHTALTSRRWPVAADDALLVTSRTRRFERAGLDERLSAGDLPRLVVATQTVEAGVDMSVPVMVTETCGWQALVQRIGRVNRYGHSTGAVHVVTTVRPETQLVYGDTAENTTALLDTLGFEIDVSPDGLARIATDHPSMVAAATGEPAPSPALTRGMLPTLVQTKPQPAADVDVQPFITGVQADRVTDVTVLWRRHCTDTTLQVMPPSRVEQVTVPVSAVRDLIRHRLHGTTPSTALSDAAASTRETATPPTWRLDDHDAMPVWVHAGHGWNPVRRHDDITPGATVVLPTSLGGHDDTGWNPAATTAVVDVSVLAAWDQGRWCWADHDTLALLYTHGRIEEPVDPEVVSEFTDEVEPDEADDLVAQLLPQLGPVTVGTMNHRGVWLRHPTPGHAHELVALEDHAGQVGAIAQTWSHTLDLPPETAGAIAWAAYHHDDGKRLPAFQAALGASGTTVLAKEHPDGRGPSAGLPAGWRHEALSASEVHNAGHSALTVHLTAAHHGWARPLLPPADGAGQNVPTADRFAALNTQYGPWGLAWLETLVRLADHAASGNPVGGYGPPTVPAPAQQPPERSPERHGLRLTGIPLDSHMGWWAVAGATAAATRADPGTTVHIDDSPAGGPVAVLTTRLSTQDIAEQVLALRDHVATFSKQHVPLTTKAEKTPEKTVRAILGDGAELTATESGIAAALFDDTQPAKEDHLLLRVPWHHNNSNLIAVTVKRAHTAADVAQALVEDTPEQHDGGGHYGLTPGQHDSMLVSGIADDSRSVLHPLVLAAAVSLPSTGGPRPVGTTHRRTRRVPLPHRPVSWSELISLLQTLPARGDEAWAPAGIDSVPYVEVSTNNGRAKAWIYQQ